ncbi:hypothetical protein Pst134EA_019298 [Puccinia striiformis f. sp. tritici]|uniref:hypothetical protein n=1 Tax=Puccinia striiformis f. sp. tritici TaxID=168172 RepID=UPI0020084CFC|nr:hypothetical protein Pst134EA_019298 [Puccinia striiformis f. sp. tritici]KAH9459143.1 hypothetical protein Pst134EA_019298 [Puccinia striiformis f. sp. tritici]
MKNPDFRLQAALWTRLEEARDEQVNESMESTELESLSASILAHDKEFQELLRMIPPKYYISQQQFSLTSFPDKQSNKKKNKKLNQTVDPELKRQQKRAKYDPDSLPTIPQLQGLNKNAGGSGGKSKTTEPCSEESDDSENEESKEEVVVQLSRAELQAKLQKRIECLQGASSSSSSQRPNSNTIATTEDQSVTVVNGKDELLDLERKKRGEMRDRRRKERKEARAKEKQIKLDQDSQKKKKSFPASAKTSNTPSGSGNLQKGGNVQAKTIVSKEDQPTLPKSKSNNQSPSKAEKPASTTTTSAEGSKSSTTKLNPASQEPDLAFSSLSFDLKQSSGLSGGVDLGGAGGSSQNKNPSWTSKKPQEAKTALDRRDAYLAKLTPEARERAEESKKWEKANLQASGTKVMDDRKKLDKAIKKQGKEKKKMKDQWSERIKVVEKLKHDKQKKRSANIQARKDQIKDKKNGVKAKGNNHSNSKPKSSGSNSTSKNNKKKSVKGF